MKEQQSLDSSGQFKNTQIEITFTNEENQKEEKFKLFNEEKESLLIKEDLIQNKTYQIKISELFQNETPEQYYINKEKAKAKIFYLIIKIQMK